MRPKIGPYSKKAMGAEGVEKQQVTKRRRKTQEVERFLDSLQLSQLRQMVRSSQRGFDYEPGEFKNAR